MCPGPAGRFAGLHLTDLPAPDSQLRNCYPLCVSRAHVQNTGHTRHTQQGTTAGPAPSHHTGGTHPRSRSLPISVSTRAALSRVTGINSAPSHPAAASLCALARPGVAHIWEGCSGKPPPPQLPVGACWPPPSAPESAGDEATTDQRHIQLQP